MGDLVAFQVLDQAAMLLSGDPGGWAADCGGQQIAWEHEHSAPHRELFDQGPLLEQGIVNVRPGEGVDASEQRQVWRGRFGRVQHRHGLRRRERVLQPVLRRERVPPGQPGPALGVVDQSLAVRRPSSFPNLSHSHDSGILSRLH